ncbi:hypothetical protein LTR05_006598 [Lithohypha guttulata]|uniref:Uncharacterized protein n=1 Tax=Lithohypha guttulata TaxID=1690604 RepID=A0AAN7YEG8_9EURO|nr:hypothetical protein LTR05_006598 [Lithohypha guttulata]
MNWIFPGPKRTPFPQYEQRSTDYHDEIDSRTSLSTHAGNGPGSVTSRRSRRSSDEHNQSQSQSVVQTVPSSASIIHYDDPFLAVDRAAATLQRTIQYLLDFQSQALSGRHNDGSTSAQSTAEHSSFLSIDAHPQFQVTPVRQPPKQRITLQGARRGIARSMQDFAGVKDEELTITKGELAHREMALSKVSEFQVQKEAIEHEIRTLNERAKGSESRVLREQATAIEREVLELENRIMELKAQQRHLVGRATQIENAAASELSSYEGTLAAIERDTRLFLRRPPVKQGLGRKNLDSAEHSQDMYALRPERRTLQLAKEQWVSELELLKAHQMDVERKRDALLQGSKLWKESILKVNNFEQGLRNRMRSGDASLSSDLVSSLNTTMHFLQSNLEMAKSRNWNLLICAIGTELEAFQQAKDLLMPEQFQQDPTSFNGQTTNDHNHIDEEIGDLPHADLLTAGPDKNAFDTLRTPAKSSLSDTSSNESLKATLKYLAPAMPGESTSLSKAALDTQGKPSQESDHHQTSFSESEDDGPGPDFLISHTD